MLSEATVVATIAVKDLEQAKGFYGGTLGLQPTNESADGVTYQCGSSGLFIYPSQYAGTNQATCAAWEVHDVPATVEDLKSKGVTFEHYDLPEVTREGDVHIMGSEKAAWFKDPDGNIFSIASR